MHDDAVAERLGSERILTDRLQDAAEGRVDDAQEDEERKRDDDKDEIVGEQLAVRLHAENRLVEEFEARLQGEGTLTSGRPPRPSATRAGTPAR